MSQAAFNIQTKRVYEAPRASDGLRVLVDRLWPRGVSKDRAAIDVWAKELAPTASLRKWFDHEPAKFDEFRRRYLSELDDRQVALDELLRRAGGEPITLVYAARDPQHNHARVLQTALTTAASGG